MGKLEDGHYVVLDPDGIIRHYEYDEWRMGHAALDAERLKQEEREVTKYAEVGRQIEGNKELREAELKEKRKVGEWTGYEIMSELKRMEEEGEEKQEFVKVMEVWEEETMYEEEYIREENVEGKLDFAEDRTKYRPNDDHSHSNTEPQDYDDMVFEIEVSVHFRDYTDERIERSGPGSKSSSLALEVVEGEERKEITDVEKREEGNKREAGRYIEVRDRTGEEKMKGMRGFKEIGLQEKTEMVHVDVKETRRTEESVQEMEKVGEGMMYERREMGEVRQDGEVEKLEYKEREEIGESILEALNVVLEEARYVHVNTGEVHLNEKQLITETTVEHVLSGGHARDAMDTHEYLVGQHMPRGPAGNDQLGSSTNEGVEYHGQAVKPSNQKSGKVEEVNTDVGERNAEETREGRKIEVHQKEDEEKMKENLVPIDVETQKGTGMGNMEVKKGKRMGEERMQDKEKTGKEKEKGLREVGKERKHFEVQEKCVEKDVGENMEVAQANTIYMEEKAGDKKSKGKSKLPDDRMTHRLQGDHAQDTKERSQGSYNVKLKLDGSIRIYRYTGRHVKYAAHDAKYEESS
jgi:hypothetical protein